jgi:pilus assembly protein Flp/PilA
MLNTLLKDEFGQGMVEYGLIIALLPLLLIGALTTFGEQLLNFFLNFSNLVESFVEQ